MAVYTGPRCRLCRREGVKLYLKGEKCYTKKCPVEKRTYAPGQHGQQQKKLSDYGVQLRQKQKMRRIYWLLERQFHLYYVEANRRKGVTGETLLQLLETRLDNVVYRLGFGSSRRESRVMVNHRHFTVNGKVVDIPSYQVRPGDVIAVRPEDRQIQLIVDSVAAAAGRRVPAWLELNAGAFEGRVLHYPNRDEIDTDVDEQLVVEYYSR
ncbi:MAG: 30S ribosomal protein S4 [Armatimonadetes bacterium]|nr:30S ribosomal protein S4 [Armatimonadota bacterium]